MSEQEQVRIDTITIITGADVETLTIDPEEDTPQIIKIKTTDGKIFTFRADGSLGLNDGRTVTIDEEGNINVSEKRAPAPFPGNGRYNVDLGTGATGVQVGTNNTQVNKWSGR